MLVCTDCGFVAAEGSEDWVPHTNNIHLGELGCYSEKYICCPNCGCTEIVVAKQCEHCREYFDPNTLVVATVEYPPDEEYPDGSEETKEVCAECYEEHYFKEEDV